MHRQETINRRAKRTGIKQTLGWNYKQYSDSDKKSKYNLQNREIRNSA